MHTHDAHDFDAREAGRDIIEDISGELIDAAHDELLDELGLAGDDQYRGTATTSGDSAGNPSRATDA